jgi:hypothetical protein
LEEILTHKINYSLEELKKIVISKRDSEIIHIIKRNMHKIIVDYLPGEVFRKYPQNINFAYQDFRKFLKSDKFNEYSIEVSNYGRVRINGKIEEQVEEKEGWFYVKTNKINYPIWRFVAEVWCEFPFEDTCGWQVHHISNDGNNNTPENLIWIKESSHNFIPKYAIDKMRSISYNEIIQENDNNANKIIEINNIFNKLLEEFIYSIILNDEKLNNKLEKLCSVNINENIDFSKPGIFNHIDSFIENILCKDENYKKIMNNIDEGMIKKIKIDFENYLIEMEKNNSTF